MDHKCRLCDTETLNGLNIFGEQGISLSIIPILSKHFDFHILSDEDGFSKFICKKCWRITDQFHKLYSNAEKILVQHKRLLGCASKLDPTKFDVLSEYNGTQINDLIKIEVPDIDEENNGHRTRPNIEVNLQQIDEDNNDSVSNQSQISEEDRQIDSIIGIECEICHMKFKCFIDLKRHFRIDHDMVGYLKCCSKKFFLRKWLYTHIQDHNYPDRYKCDLCNKNLIDRIALERHLKIHESSTKIIECTKCSQKFKRKSQLDLHTLRYHGDAKRSFQCDICMKSYYSKTAVYNHLLDMHANKSNQMCDVCAKVFKKKWQLELHHKTKHMGIVIPKVQCTICGAWLTDKYCLRKHVRRHESAEETCELCEKKFPYKSALGNHMRRFHGGRIYSCHICEKTYKSQHAYKEHIASHMGTNSYKCCFCQKVFSSASSMYKHRKKFHPIEWKENYGSVNKSLGIREVKN